MPLVRLEDWQRYLDAQFLDTIPETAPEKEPQNQAALSPVQEEPPTAQRAPLLEGSLLDEAITPQRSSALPSLPVEMTPSRRAATGGAPESGLRSFAPTRGTEPEIPSFESYLPARAAPAPRPIESKEGIPATQAFDATPEVAMMTAPDTLAGPFSVLLPMTSYAVSEAPAYAPQSPVLTPAESPKPASRTPRKPRTRAPHARNVRPDPVPSGLSAADLWAKAPRHVQTLLALERLEEESEVAQFSYKRPFPESRRELISRLLDPILSLEETARLLNVCPTTIRRYTNKGILSHYRKEPERTGDVEATERETRQRRFRLSDILAFLEAQQTALAADRQSARRDAPGQTPRRKRTHKSQETTAHDDSEV